MVLGTVCIGGMVAAAAAAAAAAAGVVRGDGGGEGIGMVGMGGIIPPATGSTGTAWGAAGREQGES